MTQVTPDSGQREQHEAEPVSAAQPQTNQDGRRSPESSPLEKPLVVTEAAQKAVRDAPTAPLPEPEAVHQPGVHVAAQLDALLAGVLAPPAAGAAAERLDLDAVIHRLLIVGLAVSGFLMVLGLALDVVLRRTVPAAVPNLHEVFADVVAGRPSGLLSLGLLVLLATPIVRVIGSMAVFLYKRDWRYTVVTLLVLLVVTLSVVLGQG